MVIEKGSAIDCVDSQVISDLVFALFSRFYLHYNIYKIPFYIYENLLKPYI